MNRRIAHAAQIVAVVLALALVPAALAAKGGNGGNQSGGGSTNGSLSLVVLDSTDGLAHWSNHVTFNVSTTATQPYVTVDCYQNGVWVMSGTRGFYPDYLGTDLRAQQRGVDRRSGRLQRKALYRVVEREVDDAGDDELPRIRIVPTKKSA